MSEAQFNKATEIVKNLPKEGPVNPTTQDKLDASIFLSPTMLSLD